MKKQALVLGLAVLLGSTGIASASGWNDTYQGPRVSASAALPGMRLVFGHPGIYCWYGGHYYNRVAWERLNRFRGQPYTYYRLDRDDFRRFDRGRDGFDRRGYRNDDGDHFNHQNYFNDHDYDRN